MSTGRIMKALLSEVPLVTLTKSFTQPYDNAIATARTCYSSKIIFDADVSKNDSAKELRDKIAKSTYDAGHHTVLQHAHFQFAIKNVSRHALWSFFHAHPFYNSEQVSQRYVEVKDDHFLVPQFNDERLLNAYLNCIKSQNQAYFKLIELLHKTCEDLYFSVYTGRKKNSEDKRWQSDIKKRTQEVARYVLPIATHAHLYHTISGLSLHRYNKLANYFDCPFEQKLIIKQMVEEVNKQDPLFFKNIEDSLDLEKTLEFQIMSSMSLPLIDSINAKNFAAYFDDKLSNKTAKLVSFTQDPISILGDSVRQILYVSPKQLNNLQALELLLSPKKNNYLAESLNILSLTKISKALDMVNFSFIKKLSHSADSQAQRHRMIPAIKPIFSRMINLQEPDYITPTIFRYESAKEAKNLFDSIQEQTIKTAKFLYENNASAESLQYILTNAYPIRYTDSASLLDHLHKWKSRLCYNAQEEIWHCSKDEVEEVATLFPEIGKFILPPCGLRHLSGTSPVCPEGTRFCGTAVWKQSLSNYKRIF